MFPKKSNKIRAKLQMNFVWKLLTWIRKAERNWTTHTFWGAPGRFRTNFWVCGAQKSPRNKKIQEIKRDLKKHHQGFTQSIRKYKKKIRQSKPSQMRSKVLDQTLPWKYDLKVKTFKLWWKNPQAFTQQQDIKKKEINHPCLLCCGPKVLVQYFSPKMSQIWPEKIFLKKNKKQPPRDLHKL